MLILLKAKVEVLEDLRLYSVDFFGLSLDKKQGLGKAIKSYVSLIVSCLLL